jgi:phytoene dehydrogenase-like protein
MPEVVIVGAGIGGLATALLLGRQGRDVVVCERDAAPAPATTEEMWSAWSRPGIPQAPLGHTFLPGFRALLAARAPDVLERLHAAGAPLVDYARDMPGGERRPEDEELKRSCAGGRCSRASCATRSRPSRPWRSAPAAT